MSDRQDDTNTNPAAFQSGSLNTRERELLTAAEAMHQFSV